MVTVGGGVLLCCSGWTLTMSATHKKTLYFYLGGQSANNDPRKYLNQLKISLMEENVSVLHMNLNQTFSHTQWSKKRQIYERPHKIYCTIHILYCLNYNIINIILLVHCIWFYLSRIPKYCWVIKLSASLGAEEAMFSPYCRERRCLERRPSKQTHLLFRVVKNQTWLLCFIQSSVLRSLTQLARWLPTQAVKMCVWSVATSSHSLVSRYISNQQNFSQ